MGGVRSSDWKVFQVRVDPQGQLCHPAVHSGLFLLDNVHMTAEKLRVALQQL